MNKSPKPWLSHYDEGVPAEIDIPPITLVELFKQAVRKFSTLDFIIHEGKALSYGDVDQLSECVANYLLSSGLRKGDRVGILLPNTPAFVISYYGILKAGGVVMALNPAYRPAEIEQLANESGVKVIILNESIYNEVKELQPRTSISACIVIGDEAEQLSPSDLLWKDLMVNYQLDHQFLMTITPNDPAIFQYSGGTTGTPKCAVGLHRNLVANVYQFNHWLINTREGKETVLVAIPLYHVYGMVLGMNLAVKMGARIVLIENPKDLNLILSSVETYAASVFPGVPNLYAAINHYPPVLLGQFDLSSIKACISGSATLPLRTKMEFETLTKGHLVEGYGLSEAPTATHCNPILGNNKDGSIGLPLPNVDCKVVDLETGRMTLGVNEIGELVVRGPQVMSGYHQHPGETEKTLRDGWLYTGDVVRMDEEGFFFIVDRKKDVIKVGGFQVWPKEIEAVIQKHPKVKEVAAAGVVNEDGSEVVKAWVVLSEGETLTVEALQSFCGQTLSRYKIPKYIEFRESLPKTRVGKVLRRELVSEHQV
jgi:long-chain acyl-CoA synthetase